MKMKEVIQSENERDVRGMKTFVGIPCQQGFSVQFGACLCGLSSNPVGEMNIQVAQSPGVGISRNILTKDFLDSGADKMLMIDSDIIFTVEHVKRILSHDVPLVGGLYTKKDPEGAVVCERFNDIDPKPNEHGLIELKYVGTGFICVTRDLIEKMVKQYGKDIRFIAEKTDRELYDFWTVGVHKPSKRYLTEDWWFCQRTLELGFKVYGDSEVRLRHMGLALYPLQANG